MTLELALAHLRSGRAREALALLEVEVAARPADTQALFASAISLEHLGRPEEALERYRRVLSLAPNFEDALNNRGLLLARLGRLSDAERSHRDYAAAYPASRRARFNLISMLLAQSRYEEAINEVDFVLAANPRDIPALVDRGMALAALGCFDEARDAFSSARSYDASALEHHVLQVAAGADIEAVLSPESIFLWRRYIAQGSCDWSGWSEYIAEFRRVNADSGVPLDPALAFASLHLPLGADERHALARRIARSIENRTAALASSGPRTRARTRIGIISPNFRDHVDAYLLLPLFELIDRKRFDLYAYSLAPDDRSAVRDRIRRAAAQFRDVSALRPPSAAQQIRRDEIDILVDTGGYADGSRFEIVAARPAPLQVLYLCFAATLGSERVDYTILDPIVAPPEHREHWSERIVYLPDTYFLYDFREKAPEHALSREEYGLPREAPVLCAFHKGEKIDPETFALWMRILQAHESAVLWLLGDRPRMADNLRAAAVRAGIDPVRLVFSGRETRDRYLARLRLADLYLDAVQHNAIVTACDCLAVGLPVLTLHGSTCTSLSAESLLRAADLPDLVARDRDHYVERAIQLLRDPGALEGLRERIAKSRSSAPLFDTAARVGELEAAFSEIWRRHATGQAPASFSVPRSRVTNR